MPDSAAPTPDAAARFFDNYLNLLVEASVPERQIPWYVKRVEEFIRAQQGRKIKQLSGADIERYFEVIGRENRLAGWQFRQCIDAIRILYSELLRTPASGEVDWAFWLDSARRLGIDHPTTVIVKGSDPFDP
jgi:hypothetical protein